MQKNNNHFITPLLFFLITTAALSILLCMASAESENQENEIPADYVPLYKNVIINTDPPNVKIFQESRSGLLNNLGLSSTEIQLNINAKSGIILYFIKNNPQTESQKNDRSGYKNNCIEIPQDYFMNLYKKGGKEPYMYPVDGGKIILKPWSFQERAQLFISHYFLHIIIALIIFIVALAVSIRRIKRHLTYHKLLTERKALAEADLSALDGEIADIVRKKLKGKYNTYEIKGLIGEGGMSVVCEGWKELTYDNMKDASNETYAIKVIKPQVAKDPDFIERFRREVEVCIKLVHPSIVQVYDWGEDSSLKILFIVMEKVSGHPLSDLIQDNVPLDFKRAAKWTLGLLEGLSYAHHKKIVHRDIKPGNVFITDLGKVKILDFGIARKLDAKTITKTDVALGTPHYLPPEQLNAKYVDERADLYSVGVMLYQMLTGVLPFQGDTIQIITQHLHDEPTPPSKINREVTPSLEKVVLTLLKKRPDERYRSADEAKTALEAATRESMGVK